MEQDSKLKSKRGKVWVIGLDGASFDQIMPWIRAGELPTLKRLMGEGAWGELRSPIAQSPPAWASFMTGCNPGKHGIYDWFQPRPGSYELDLVCGASCRSETLWGILSSRGRSVGVVNVPMTYPPEVVNGFLIAGFDAPYGSKDFTHPPDLYTELENRFGQYIILPIIAGVPLSQTVQNFHETIIQREKVMRFLLKRYDPEFFMLVFNATDSLAHLCLQSYTDNGKNTVQLQSLKSIYQRLDAVLAKLLQSMNDETTLFVVSDHGGGPLRSYVHIDNWLAQNEWLTFASDNPELAFHSRNARLLGNAVETIKSIIPTRLKSKLKARLGNLKARVEKATTSPVIDWEHTQAHTFGSHQGIYINLKGRQPQGVVEPGIEYEELCQQIIQNLMELKDADNEEYVVERVSRKDEIFVGSFTESSPDLYVYWKDDSYLSRSDESFPRSQIFQRPRPLEMKDIVPTKNAETRVGCHRQEGLFLMYGNKIKSGKRIEGAQIVDIAPTILTLMGEPIPSHMDGKVLREGIDDVYLTTLHPRKTSENGTRRLRETPVYSDEESELIKERLRNLGYL